MVEALLPTPRLNHQPEDEAAVAQVQMSEAHLADPSVPVFWVLPKGLITTIFPPFTSPPEAFTAGHKALNYVASAALMVVICLTTRRGGCGAGVQLIFLSFPLLALARRVIVTVLSRGAARRTRRVRAPAEKPQGPSMLLLKARSRRLREGFGAFGDVRA